MRCACNDPRHEKRKRDTAHTLSGTRPHAVHSHAIDFSVDVRAVPERSRRQEDYKNMEETMSAKMEEGFRSEQQARQQAQSEIMQGLKMPDRWCRKIFRSRSAEGRDEEHEDGQWKYRMC